MQPTVGCIITLPCRAGIETTCKVTALPVSLTQNAARTSTHAAAHIGALCLQATPERLSNLSLTPRAGPALDSVL
eukprot:scaffold68417_cov45-Phaeocystis_antarctica.AAC.2